MLNFFLGDRGTNKKKVTMEEKWIKSPLYNYCKLITIVLITLRMRNVNVKSENTVEKKITIIGSTIDIRQMAAPSLDL